MPIKNKARPSNSGLEGKLVGLDTDEKNSLSSDFGGGTTFIENEQALNDLIDQGKIYEGMILYRKDVKKFYQVSKSSDGQWSVNEFGGGENVVVVESGLDDSTGDLTIRLTEEKFNQIYDTDCPVIMTVSANVGYLLGDVSKSLVNNEKKIEITPQIFVLVGAGYNTIVFDTATFSLNSLVQVVKQSGSFSFSPTFDEYNNLGLSLMVGETSSDALLLPNLNSLDRNKYYIIQVINGTITWVEKTSSSDTAIITLSDSQALELADNKITFTQAQIDIIKKSSALSFVYKGQELIKGYLNVFFSNNNTFYSINSFTGSLLTFIVFNDSEALQQQNVLNIAIEIPHFNVENGSLFLHYSDTNEDTEKVYVDTINNAPIVHEKQSEAKNYNIPIITFVD